MQPYPNLYNYQQPYYNPTMQTQQRLSMLEQQYPQFSSSPVLKGRPVSSFDEAKAAMIDLDGSVFYFIDSANNAIYSKQINLDGTASINVYKKVVESEEQHKVDPVMKDEFTVEINKLQDQINTIMEEITNDKSDANVQRKYQSIKSVNAISE